MADPARYYIDPTLVVDASGNAEQAGLTVERSESGDWIKWHDFVDFKAAQRRNASLETNTALGVEIANLRAENERLRKTIDNIGPLLMEAVNSAALAVKGGQS